MNLRAVDLNLLVVLDALIEERSVSRAARRVGLSQPATSAALGRCRHLFSDPLLERVRGSMRLTSRAEAMHEPIKEILSSVAALVAPREIDLKTVRQTVTLLMADVLMDLALPDLLEELATSAPGIDLSVLPWPSSTSATEALVSGSCDLAVSVIPSGDRSIRRELLFEENYRILMRRDHPAAASFDLDTWLDYPHVIVTRRGLLDTRLDEQLAAMERDRRVGLAVPSFTLVPQLLLRTDLIAMLPSRCVPTIGRDAYAIFDPPLPISGFPIHIAWHTRSDVDPVVQHVASRMREALAPLAGSPDGAP